MQNVQFQGYDKLLYCGQWLYDKAGNQELGLFCGKETSPRVIPSNCHTA